MATILLSEILCRPNMRALSPVETTPFLMLLGDQLVLLHGKGYASIGNEVNMESYFEPSNKTKYSLSSS